MTQFVLIRTFLEEEKLQSTKVLGVYTDLLKAQAYANGLIEEIRENMEWEDEAPKWVWDADLSQWSTTDFPTEMDTYHLYTIDLV